MWPSINQAEFGIFVKEQVEGVKKYNPKVNFEVFFINGRKSSLNYLISIFKLNFYLIFNRIDLIHIHFGLSGVFSLVNPFIKCPIVTTMHGSDLNNQGSSSLINWISRKVAHRSDEVILVNKLMLAKLPNIKSKVSILPCGIDTNFFSPLKKIRTDRIEVQIGFPSSKERFVKNYPLFVEIISLLEKIYQLKIRIVEFTNKSRSEIHQSLNEIDLLLMTSLSEGSPQIIKEALCCNTPIVSTNVGDVSNLLKGVDNSCVVETFEPTDFLKPIIKILDQNIDNKLCSNGRTKIFKLGLDEESVSKRLINIYKELISDKRPRVN